MGKTLAFWFYYHIIFLSILILLFITSCNLFNNPVTIERPVQAVWFENDLLVAYSLYTTTKPEIIYHADTNTLNWRYRLEIWPNGDQDNKTILGTFTEKNFPGYFELSRIHWNRDYITIAHQRLPYMYRFISVYGNLSLRKYDIFREQSFLELADLSITETQITLEDFVLKDLVPSPDGKIIAALWSLSYDIFHNSIPIADFTNEIISFHEPEDGTFIYGIRIQRAPPEIEHPLKNSFGPLNPAYPLRNLVPYRFNTWSGHSITTSNYLIWKNDSSGVFALSFSGEALFMVFDPDGKPLPLLIDELPNRSIPTNSGPINADGRIVSISTKGNTFILNFQTDTNWIAFEEQTMIFVSDIIQQEVY